MNEKKLLTVIIPTNLPLWDSLRETLVSLDIEDPEIRVLIYTAYDKETLEFLEKDYYGIDIQVCKFSGSIHESVKAAKEDFGDLTKYLTVVQAGDTIDYLSLDLLENSTSKVLLGSSEDGEIFGDLNRRIWETKSVIGSDLLGYIFSPEINISEATSTTDLQFLILAYAISEDPLDPRGVTDTDRLFLFSPQNYIGSPEYYEKNILPLKDLWDLKYSKTEYSGILKELIWNLMSSSAASLILLNDLDRSSYFNKYFVYLDRIQKDIILIN